MRVSEKKEFIGEFYLPSNPDRKVSGILKIGLDGKVSLEIAGNFEETPHKTVTIGRKAEFNIPLINGEVTVVGHVALVDCYHPNSFALGGPQPKTTISASFALCDSDVGYENKDEIKFNTLRFSVEHLNRWLNCSGVTRAEGDLKDGMAINYALPEDVTVKLSDGVEIRFCFDATPPWYPHFSDGVNVAQNAHITLTSDQPRSLSYFIDMVNKINVFLCLALGEIVCIKDVKVPGKHRPVQIYYQSFIHTEKPSKWSRSDAICRFHDIRENFPAILNEWVKNYELTRPTYHLYLICRMGGVKYIEVMFLTLVQALENLHGAARVLYPGWPARTTLEKKLNKLIFTFEDAIPDDCSTMSNETFKDFVMMIADYHWHAQGSTMSNEIIKDVVGKKMWNEIIKEIKTAPKFKEMWNEIIKDVVGVRGYLTHYDRNTAPEFKEKSENPNVLCFLYQKLEAIIQLHFLKQIGFNNQEIDKHLKTVASRLSGSLRIPYRE